MKTFAEPKKMVVNSCFQEQRQQCLMDFTCETIDAPITKLIQTINSYTYCFTIQSCYGHFVYQGQNDSKNLKP